MFTGLSPGTAVDDDSSGDAGVLLVILELFSVVVVASTGADEVGRGLADDERFCNAEVLNRVDKLIVDIVVVVVYAAVVENCVVGAFLVVVALVVVVFGLSVVEGACVVVLAVVVLACVVVVEILLVVGAFVVVVVDFSVVESF